MQQLLDLSKTDISIDRSIDGPDVLPSLEAFDHLNDKYVWPSKRLFARRLGLYSMKQMMETNSH